MHSEFWTRHSWPHQKRRCTHRLVFCAHFVDSPELVVIFATGSFCIPPFLNQDGNDAKMRLKIRNYDIIQYIDLEDKDTEELWVSLSLKGDDLSQEERHQKIQEAWEIEFNRPEYNNWHKFDRHRGFSKAQPGKEDSEDAVDVNEPLMDEVADDRLFRKDELDRAEREEYEDVCSWIRQTLVKKPNWAEAFIAVRMDGVSVNDYAASIGVSDASVVSKWLARVTKKLRDFYPNRQK